METRAEYDIEQESIPAWQVRYRNSDQGPRIVYANQAPGAAMLFMQQEWSTHPRTEGWDVVQVSRDGTSWVTYKVFMELRPIYSAKLIEE